ncbi:MAG: TIGR01906 family membrane protein [Tissierellia bacterium]|nr:TIGR01906 family membrane protein [Tissierellia bacterium]
MRRYPLYFLLALGLLWLALTAAVHGWSLHQPYYNYKMEANAIDRVTGRSLEELETITQDLRKYLWDGEEGRLSPYFSGDEVAHMLDVYGLFHLMREVAALAGLVVLLLGFYGISSLGLRTLARGVGRSSWLILGLLLLLFFIVALDFHRAFFAFHRIFFTNDLWLMDPNTDLMIQMLPENFFSDLALRIALTFALACGLIAALGFLPKGRGSGQEGYQ